MDYTKQSLLFRLRKVARYVSLYGLPRTLVKVRGQYHMKAKPEAMQPSGPVTNAKQSVALIGCGNYAFSNIAYYLKRNFGPVIGSCMDRNLHRAASLARHYGAPHFTDDVADVWKNDHIRLVYIASNHASHADYAIEALALGKHVYIEKPHVVSEAQLRALMEAMERYPGRVFLGFNRPGSRLGRIILDHLAAQEGPGVYNWFVAGHAIDPDHWYFRPEEGGRVLGNLCHWTDFVMQMASGDTFPVQIVPARGNRPDTDIAVSYVFPDDTIAVITFSAKGHTFEGVRERLSAHRGDLLLIMEDYKTLLIEIGARRLRYSNWYRDHGHENNITAAYRSVHDDLPYDRAAMKRYIADTAWLFLQTRVALETRQTLEVRPYADAPSLQELHGA
jgi:predicted dehydrogenase